MTIDPKVLAEAQSIAAKGTLSGWSGRVDHLAVRFARALIEAAAEIEALRSVLEFYADPFGKCDQVPDFYSECNFGDRAHNALQRRREVPGGTPAKTPGEQAP